MKLLSKNLFFLLACILLCSCIISCSSNKKQETVAVSESLDELNKEIEDDPENASLYYQRAKYFNNKNQFESSIADIKKAVSIDSTHSEFYDLMGDVYFVSNRVDDAMHAFDKSIMLDNNNIEVMIKQAQILLFRKKNIESIALLDKVLKKDIHNGRAYFMKGMNFKDLKDTAKAISSFQTTIEQAPDYYSAYIQLGLLHAAKHSTMAIGYYKAAYKVHPKMREPLYNLGMFYQEHGDIENAILTYSDLITKFPDSKMGYFNLGYLHHFHKKDLDKAIKYYSDAIVSAPYYIEARHNRALAYEELKDLTKAKTDYQFILDLYPDYQPAKAGLKRIK